jgi:hypothetical protein
MPAGDQADAHGDAVTYELYYSGDAARATHGNNMAALESRLARIEKAMGGDMETVLVWR